MLASWLLKVANSNITAGQEKVLGDVILVDNGENLWLLVNIVEHNSWGVIFSSNKFYAMIF